MKIMAIKQPHGYYIYQQDFSSWFLQNLFINGEHPVSTFTDDWFFVPEKPTKIEEEKSQPNINFRYELIDPSMQSEKISLSFKKEEVIQLDEGNYSVWKEEYRHLQSLYKLVSDPQPTIMVEIPFKLVELYEADHEAQKPVDFSYPVKSGPYKEVDTITNERLKHRLLDEMYVSDLYLHEKPCRISSKNLYNIIREHVNRNINSQYAVVTSNYDFCFTVKKRLKLADPIKYTVNINSDRKRAKPKYVERYTVDRDVEIFNMTSREDAYKGYQILPDLEAASEIELKEKIDEYLADLMEFINAPLIDCPCCNGTGAVVPELRKP